MKGIADTGLLVAFANRTDRHHGWAVGLAEQVTEPLVTCDAVLAEASFHLEDAGVVLAMVQEKLVLPAFDVAANLEQLAWLARKYADRSPDLADLCLIRLSELHPKHRVLTIDEDDFRVYRRNKREAIPLITPSVR
jgi:predicted nucleic acid-binding protein